MSYFKRMSRMILIALSLSLLLSTGILLTQQMIRASLSHNQSDSDNPMSALSHVYVSYKGKVSKGEKLFSWKGDDKTEKGNGKPVKEEKLPEIESKNKFLPSDSAKEMNWIILGMVFLILAIITFIFLKKRKNRTLQESSLEVHLQASKEKKSNKSNRTIDEQNHLPTEEIRLMLIEWEKQLPKTQQRHSYETIQQWFERIDKNQDFVPLYEKVRYGNKTLLSEEIELVRNLFN